MYVRAFEHLLTSQNSKLSSVVYVSVIVHYCTVHDCIELYRSVLCAVLCQDVRPCIVRYYNYFHFCYYLNIHPVVLYEKTILHELLIRNKAISSHIPWCRRTVGHKFEEVFHEIQHMGGGWCFIYIDLFLYFPVC